MIQSREPSAPSARRLRARLAALLGILLAALAPLALPSAASAAASVVSQATTPSPSPSPSIVPGEAVFTLSPIANGILEPGESPTVSVTMTNDRAVATPSGTVSLFFGTTPLADRAALSAWLGGDTTIVGSREIATTPFPAVEAGEQQPKGIMVTGQDALFDALAPGVYGIVATLETPDESYTSTSAVVVPDDSPSEVGIGVVVPITAPATAEGVLTADQLAGLTAPNGSLTAQLDAVEGTDAILAVDPAIPAAIRVLGTAAPASAVEWLVRLLGLANTRFALQFGDADVASQVQAGIVPPLRPKSLQAYMSAEDFLPPEDEPATPEPTPTADPTAPVYPDLETLLDIGPARAGVFWPDTGTAGADVVAELGDLTVDGLQGLTLIPSTTTVAGSGGATVAARGQAGESPVLVYDAAVSSELQQASTHDEGTIRSAYLAAATAYLSFAVDETGGAPLLVTVERGQDRSRVALRTAITTALEAPWVTPYSLGRLANATSSDVEVVEVEPDVTRVDAASTLLSEEDELTQFSSVLDDPALLTGPERAEILQLLGEAWRPQPDAWGVALATHRDESAAALDSVGILRASPIQLITSGAVIPVWVRNDLPYPVNVTLLASPDDLRLEVQETTRVVAQPQSNTRVEVPVQAQIGSGDVTIALELRSPTGVPIGDPQVRDVHVRADWEGIGIGLVVALAGGFVLLGIIRTVLRRRRRPDASAEPEGTDEGPAAADAAADESSAERDSGSEEDSSGSEPSTPPADATRGGGQ